MSVLKKEKKFQKDIAKVRSFSALVGKKLEKMQKSDEDKIENLTVEELQDFNKILQITNFLLCKYEDKKEVHSLLKEFVSMIDTDSMGIVNDDIDELVLSADSAIKRIKELQSNVSEHFTVDSAVRSDMPKSDEAENSGNNLTKSSTGAYTTEYQPKSTLESEQVI